MRNYTLKQIQTFMEVARQGSVSKAAERLFVTQPAVSMHLRQLEEAFGVALFEPHGRGIRLTDAGRAFASSTMRVMAELHELESLMAAHAGAKKGRFTLAVVSTAKYFVPMLLVRFAELHPDVEVVLRIDNRENVLACWPAARPTWSSWAGHPPIWRPRPCLLPPTPWASSRRRSTY